VEIFFLSYLPHEAAIFHLVCWQLCFLSSFLCICSLIFLHGLLFHSKDWGCRILLNVVNFLVDCMASNQRRQQSSCVVPWEPNILHINYIYDWQIALFCADVYYDVKPTYTYEAQACNCVLPSTPGHKGCGEDCINRMVYSECSPQLCPCKELCSNQRIQRHEWAPGLEKFMTKDKVDPLVFHGDCMRSPLIIQSV
jgi:hypothetical protein